MTFLPVVGRELRAASRRRSTYWVRFFAALVTIGICAWLWFVSDRNMQDFRRGAMLFAGIASVSFIYALVAGITVTADCLSEEKREGTLGLLFLTDLKGYDVVLGKLTASSLDCIYRLVAVFPVMAIPLLLGGLTMSEFWRMVLVLMNTLFLSLSAGMLASALSRHERKAMACAFVLILLVMGALPLAGWLLSIRGNHPMDTVFLLPSSGYAFYLVEDRVYRTLAQEFWTSVSVTNGVGWIFLAIASLILPRSWQDRPAGAKIIHWKDRWQRWRFGDVAVRSAYRRRLLQVNPFFWLAARNRLKPAYVLGLLGVTGCFWLWLYFKVGRDLLDPAIYVTTAILLHTVLKFWVASESCRPLSEDRRSGALELLLSTPLSVVEILQGQMLSLKRQFALGAALILLADLVMFLSGMRDRFVDTTNGWLMLFLAGVLMFVADLYTLSWVGMWLGLTAKSANRAARGAVLRILVLPWLIFILFVTFLLFSDASSSGTENMLLGGWFAIGMITNLYFFIWAKSQLIERFRLVVTQRFDHPKHGQPDESEEVKPPLASEPAGAA